MEADITLQGAVDQLEYRWLMLAAAWIVTLLVSTLPDVILAEILYIPAPWLIWAFRRKKWRCGRRRLRGASCRGCCKSGIGGLGPAGADAISMHGDEEWSKRLGHR